MIDHHRHFRRRLDTAAIAFAAVLPTAVTLVYFVVLSEQPHGVQQAAWALGKLGQFAFPLFWIFGIQGARVRIGPIRWRGLGTGVVSGVLMGAVIVGLYHLWLGPSGVLAEPTDAMHAKLAGLGLDSVARYLAFAAFLSLAHSFLEEYYFRWFVFGQMRRLLSVKSSIALASVAFAAHHVLVLAVYFGWASPLTWLGVAGVAAGGAFWAWLYDRTGSLLGPWISHLLVDAAIMAVGYDLLLA